MQRSMMNMKTLLCFFAWTVAWMQGTIADDHTYVSNQSSRTLRATTSYKFSGKSGFVERVIPPNGVDGDQYSSTSCNFKQGSSNVGLYIEVWIDGGPHSGGIPLVCDQSIVGFDNTDKSGVEIYYSASGNLNLKIGTPIMTLRPN